MYEVVKLRRLYTRQLSPPCLKFELYPLCHPDIAVYADKYCSEYIHHFLSFLRPRV